MAKLFSRGANKGSNSSTNKDKEVEPSPPPDSAEPEWEDEIDVRAEKRKESRREKRKQSRRRDNTDSTCGDESKDVGEEEENVCMKLFFIWMYITATIYGSISVVSAFLLLLAFRYVSWFESERERDLFQFACLGFTIMFSLIVTSMWISFKEKQYGWAFVASLPSVAVFSAVIIILQTGDIGPAATTAPSDYYYGNGDYDMNYDMYDANGQAYGYDQGNGGGY